ncbi:glycosyltransferase family 4 protein [Thermohalobacter berrensis]|uniref:Glycosyl transferase n=1 Tax=Thermohalobacter berrensis TaxID=99594 RepID=A0A419T496_9FIRM|nr:glycosyltransferase family 4 protein [Thermohalobacter berrensis]RKD32282.1 glycosyl transferase [Thermohalobacter berrensis]
MKVAIVHDWLTNMGGAERIILILHELFPKAPIYTLVYNSKNMPDDFRNMDIRTSFLQKIPFSKKKYQNLLPLMPIAVEQFDLSEYDLVISSSTCCAKGVLTRANTLHISYCNTPMRYGWDFYHEYIKDKNIISKSLIAGLMNHIRMWDKVSSDRVDYFIANSNNVKKRIQKHYRRDAQVIYPPVNTDFYTPSNKDEEYYLIVSRLVSYKRIDLAIEVFNDLGLPLVIIGDGPELARYKKIAKNNITFLGRLSDEEVREYYRRCKAFIFPGEEDFGITPVEAQACGRPVIAYGKGGALETVVNEKTGLFFHNQSVDSLKKVVTDFQKGNYNFDKKTIRNHALRFSINRFKKDIMEFINEKINSF